MMGGKCIKCGFSDPRALQIDHINGEGNKERRTLQSQKLYLKILKEGFLDSENSKKYQLLCANCNHIKRFENKEF